MKHAVILACFLLPFLTMGQSTKPSGAFYKQRISQLGKLSQLYNQIDYIDDCKFVIVTDSENQQGIVDLSGKELLPCQYRIFRQSGTSLFLVADDHKLGLLNKHAKWVLPMEYEHDIDCFECMEMGNFFSKGYACLSKGRKHGLVDTTGKVLIPFKFDQRFEVDMPNQMLYFGLYEDHVSKTWITDFNGYLIIGPYEFIGRFSEGLASFERDGKYGFLSTKGKTIIPCKYECCGWTEFSNGCVLVGNDGKHMLIDKNGQTKHVFDPAVFIEYCLWDNSIFIVTQRGKDDYPTDKYGAVDGNGNPLIPIQYERWYILNGKYLALDKYESGCDIYDKSGRFVVHFQQFKGMEYDEGTTYSSNYSAAMQDSLWGFVDKDLKTVIPFRYKEATYLGHGYGRVRTADGQTLCIDMSDRTVISGPYEYVSPVSDDLFKFYASNPKDGDEIIVGFVDIYGNSTASKKQLEKMNAWSQQR